jgi:hypothetical protein
MIHLFTNHPVPSEALLTKGLQTTPSYGHPSLTKEGSQGCASQSSRCLKHLLLAILGGAAEGRGGKW